MIRKLFAMERWSLTRVHKRFGLKDKKKFFIMGKLVPKRWSLGEVVAPGGSTL